MRDFRELQVWQKAHQVTLKIYRATEAFPPHERYGLTSQMRRASVSVPTNIAEGNGRGTDAEMIRFLHIALGSAGELEYLLLLSRDLGYLTEVDYTALADEVVVVGRMLTTFVQRLEAKG